MHYNPYMVTHYLFILVINLLVAAALLWVGATRINDMQQLHHNIANESVILLADNTSRFLQDKNRFIKIFAGNELGLIRRLAQSPDDTSLNSQLSTKIHAFFPNHFTFTLANNQGETLIDDFEGFIGDICVNDIKRFSLDQIPLPRIHPNPESYHFDVITKYGDDEGILFISFHSDILGHTVKSIEAQGHQLLLILTSESHLIEVTSDGARNHWRRDDYRMSIEEKDRILATKTVDNSTWTAIDMSTPALFETIRRHVIFQSVVTQFIFLMVCLSFLVLVWRTEKKGENSCAKRHLQRRL